MSKITLTQALVELKNLTKKIESSQERVLVGFNQNGTVKFPAGYSSEEDFKKDIQATIDSPIDLINYRDSLKSKLALANATTFVSVGSQKMTIAEAIERKNSVSLKRSLLTKLKSTKSTLENSANVHNQGLQARADKFVVDMYGNNSNASTQQREETKKQWLATNSVKTLTDPKVDATITSLEKEIDEFVTNVDVALSVINATTYIEV